MRSILGPFKNTYIMIHKGKQVPHYCWAAFQFPDGTKFKPSTVIRIPTGVLFCRTASFGAEKILREAKIAAIKSVLTDHFGPLSDEELCELRAMKWRAMTKQENMLFRFQDESEVAKVYEPGHYIVTGGWPSGSRPLLDISEATASQSVPEVDHIFIRADAHEAAVHLLAQLKLM